MDNKMKVLFLVLLVAVSSAFCGCFSASNQVQYGRKLVRSGGAEELAANRIGSLVFPIRGDVYPTGYFYAVLNISIPPQTYHLDIDTGSVLTWVQCHAPNSHYYQGPHPLYHHNVNFVVMAQDPLCASLDEDQQFMRSHNTRDDQCRYQVEYADGGSSKGILVKDAFPLRFINRPPLAPLLAFGCGYDQRLPNEDHPPSTDGVLGLGRGKVSIVSQLHDQGLIRNVMGHCISTHGSGFLFLGNDLVPSSGVVWAPMSPDFLPKYSPGPAELLYGGKPTGVRSLSVIFDSGSSYTYFSSRAYEVFVSSVHQDLNRKHLREAPEEHALPMCWRGARPFKSIRDVRKFFKPIALSFNNDRKAQFEIPPKGYLIITSHGHVCLGILNGTQIGLQDTNIIGDISFQDKMVVFDNEKQQIGWITANCDKLPKSYRALF